MTCISNADQFLSGLNLIYGPIHSVNFLSRNFSKVSSNAIIQLFLCLITLHNYLSFNFSFSVYYVKTVTVIWIWIWWKQTFVHRWNIRINSKHRYHMMSVNHRINSLIFTLLIYRWHAAHMMWLSEETRRLGWYWKSAGDSGDLFRWCVCPSGTNTHFTP